MITIYTNKLNYENKHNSNKSKKSEKILRVIMILISIFLLATTVSGQAQNNSQKINPVNSTKKILHVDQYIASKKQQIKNAVGTQLRVEKLIYDVQPAVYFKNNVMKLYGEQPVSLFTDIKSLGAINATSFVKNNIEIVTIKIENASDLNLIINLNLLSEFPNLQYIYIISNVKCTESQIINLVKSENPKLDVFFNIEKNS